MAVFPKYSWLFLLKISTHFTLHPWGIYMKKIIFHIVIFAVICIAASCQPTPSTEYVVVKENAPLAETSDDRKEEVSDTKDEAPEAYEVPDKWQEVISIPGQTNGMVVDAVIRAPENPRASVLQVAKSSFSAEVIKSAAETMLPHIVGYSNAMQSLAELEEMLLGAKRGLYRQNDDGTYEYVPYDGQQEQINRIEAMIQEAENADEQIYPLEDAVFSWPTQVRLIGDDGSTAALTVSEDYLYLYKGQRGILQSESMVKSGAAIPGEEIGTEIGDVGLSQEDAIRIAEDMLENIGADSMRLAESSKGRLLAEHSYAVLNRGWILYYFRNDGGYIPLNHFNVSFNGFFQFEEADYMAPWRLESITMYVTQDGIVSLTWRNPLEVTEVIAADEELLDFDVIQHNFRILVRYGLSNLEPDSPIVGEYMFDEIILTGSLAAKKDDPSNAYIVPTWAFLFRNKENPQNGMPIVIAINGLDGSRMYLQSSH